MKHKHADLIHAWADGAQIQYFYHGEWVDWESYTSPSWGKTIEYRIKPDPKPDVVVERCIASWTGISTNLCPNIRVVFDGETGNLKSAEVL
jgi:hypothetical protein